MPQVKKAELIEGIAYMASALRAKAHGEPHARVMAWLGLYWASTPGIQLLDNATVRLDADNEVQPDTLLRIEKGGMFQKRVTVSVNRQSIKPIPNMLWRDDTYV